MRQRMRRIMRDHGCEPRPGDELLQRLLAGLRAGGGRPIDEQEVASWTVASTPEESLRSWRGKDGLAGADPPPDEKRAILHELEAWAAHTFGSLSTCVSSTETYVLEGAEVRA